MNLKIDSKIVLKRDFKNIEAGSVFTVSYIVPNADLVRLDYGSGMNRRQFVTS